MLAGGGSDPEVDEPPTALVFHEWAEIAHALVVLDEPHRDIQRQVPAVGHHLTDRRFPVLQGIENPGRRGDEGDAQMKGLTGHGRSLHRSRPLSRW